MDPITQQILEKEKVTEFIKYPKPKTPEKEALYFGFDISIEEYTAFIGGKGKLRSVINNLKKLLMADIKKDKDIVFEKFEYSDTASVGWAKKPGQLSIGYSIWAVDKTGHMKTAAHSILFKNGKNDFEIISGWDG